LQYYEEFQVCGVKPAEGKSQLSQKSKADTGANVMKKKSPKMRTRKNSGKTEQPIFWPRDRTRKKGFLTEGADLLKINLLREEKNTWRFWGFRQVL